jgi:adenosylhomocysteine nucleosidase
MKRVAIIAAMAGELKPLVKGWEQEFRSGVRLWRKPNDEGEWVAACAGAGAEAATRALAEVEKDGTISEVFSVGWAGALRDEIQPGKAYWVSGVIDARTGENFESGEIESHTGRKSKDAARVGHPNFRLVTSPVVASAEEKRRLAVSYQASMVDMEAAAVARLAQMRGIPFCCVKGISDGYRDQLPDFTSFISTQGQFSMARFVLFALLHPQYWLALRRMGENSRKAARQINDLLLDFFDERGRIRERNGYPHN